MGDVIDAQTFEKLDLKSAVEKELATGSRLMPRRADLLTLAQQPEEVAAWLRPRLRKGTDGGPADLVLADKGWRGSRPLHGLSLEDRVLYRALVESLLPALPDAIRTRQGVEAFRRAPLEVPDVQYVTKTDVTAYYEYVDHEILMEELVSQTGEEPLVAVLGNLLNRVMGRRIGLPQVSRMSDVLGDTYIDIARRRLIRRGYATFTYSDDFRIATPTLGNARAALEACAHEVRSLGLVLNERKTWTYGSEHYEQSLTAFRDAEMELFDSNDAFLLDDYADEDAGLLEAETTLLSTDQVGGEVEEVDAILERDLEDQSLEPDAAQVRAAERAWTLWVHEDETEDAQSGMTAAITQSLLGHALPILGAAGRDEPLESLSPLMRYEPSLTPQVCAYLIAFAREGRQARRRVRDAIDGLVQGELLSGWQSVWIAYTAGTLRGGRLNRPHVAWLSDALRTDTGAYAGHAALTLARLGHADADDLASALDRVRPGWRSLVFLALCQVDPTFAEQVADSELDRVLLRQTAR